MKTKLLLSALLSFYFCLLSSQVPQGINYQAIAKDGKTPITTTIPVRITIQTEPSGGDVLWVELHSSIMPNESGLFSLVLGTGTRQSGLAGFSDIDWGNSPKYIKTEIDHGGWIDMGTSAIWSVPYSLVAKNLEGPVGKLGVSGTTANMEEALFEVKNKDGQTVFAVYNEGVRINVADGDTNIKGAKGGFAIGGFDVTKGTTHDLLVVNSDSIRAYVYDNPSTKGAKGGFAIGGFDLNKSLTNDYFLIGPGGATINVDNAPSAKGAKGGFAIGGFDRNKGAATPFVNLTPKNYFIGHEAGLSITTGLYNSFIGYQAGRSNTDGEYNIFIGYQSGFSNTGPPTPDWVGGNYGSFNTYLGYKTGYYSLHGAHNTLIGYASGTNNTSDNNTFLGSLAGSQNSVGANNTFIGTESGSRNSTGGANVFLGRWAGWNVIDGSNNTFLGTYAGSSLGSGQGNVIIGSGATAERIYGGTGKASSNVIMGFQAGYEVIDSSANIFIGYQAGFSASGGKNVFLGYQAGYSETGSDLLYIDNSNTSSPLIWGDFAANRVKINGSLNISELYVLDEEILVPEEGSTLTPTKANVILNPASAVTLNSETPIANGLTPGQVLILRGTSDSNTLSVNDSGNVMLSGPIVLGDSDTLMLIWSGTHWVQISYSDN